MFVLLVETVVLNELYKVTKEESLAFSQPLFAAFLTYIWLLSSVSAHKSWGCNAFPLALVDGAEVAFISSVEPAPPASIAAIRSAAALDRVTASSLISAVATGSVLMLKVKVAGDDSTPRVLIELTLAT